MSVRRALELSQQASVRTPEGQVLHLRLAVGWERPEPGLLDQLEHSGVGLVELVVLLGTGARDAVRARRYRRAGRTDWWTLRVLDDGEPEATRHPDRAAAVAAAERELLEAVGRGGRYLPYGS